MRLPTISTPQYGNSINQQSYFRPNPLSRETFSPTILPLGSVSPPGTCNNQHQFHSYKCVTPRDTANRERQELCRQPTSPIHNRMTSRSASTHTSAPSTSPARCYTLKRSSASQPQLKIIETGGTSQPSRTSPVQFRESSRTTVTATSTKSQQSQSRRTHSVPASPFPTKGNAALSGLKQSMARLTIISDTKHTPKSQIQPMGSVNTSVALSAQSHPQRMT